jgi:hypothetical protein
MQVTFVQQVQTKFPDALKPHELQLAVHWLGDDPTLKSSLDRLFDLVGIRYQFEILSVFADSSNQFSCIAPHNVRLSASNVL